MYYHIILCAQRSSTLKTMSSRSSMFRNAYPARMMRKTSAPITRAHHWGFMSLRPIPPLSSQQLMSLKEVCERVDKVCVCVCVESTNIIYIYTARCCEKSQSSKEVYLSRTQEKYVVNLSFTYSHNSLN